MHEVACLRAIVSSVHYPSKIGKDLVYRDMVAGKRAHKQGCDDRLYFC